MATSIAANAWVDPRAELDHDVEIGPFCTIGPDVKDRSWHTLAEQRHLDGPSHDRSRQPALSERRRRGRASGYHYQGGDTCVEIGNGNTLREGVTVNRGSEKEDGVTRLGRQELS